MPRTRWLAPLVVAAACAGAMAAWIHFAKSPASEPGLAATASPAALSREDARVGAALDAIANSSESELDKKLDEYLGAVKQAYGSQVRALIEKEQPSELSIPVPPVDPIESEVPSLLPDARADRSLRP